MPLTDPTRIPMPGHSVLHVELGFGQLGAGRCPQVVPKRRCNVEQPNSPSRRPNVSSRQRCVKMCREMAQHGHAKDYAVKYYQGSDRLMPCHPFLPNRNTTPHILSEGMDGGE